MPLPASPACPRSRSSPPLGCCGTHGRSPSTPGAGWSSTATRPRRCARSASSTRSPAASTRPAGTCCSRPSRPTRSTVRSCSARSSGPRRSASQDRPLGPARFEFITGEDLYRAALDHVPYRARALVNFGANLVMGHGNSARGRDALAALDFFVHADLFMNPTAEQADIVLPVTSAFESEALRVGFEISQDAQSTRAAAPAPGAPARRGALGPADRLRPGRSAGTGRSVLRWRHRGGMAPPARSERDHPRAVARAPRGRPVAVADEAPQVSRPRFPHADGQGRAVLAGLRSRRLPADSDVSPSRASARSPGRI